jgi:O-methyltransferase
LADLVGNAQRHVMPYDLERLKTALRDNLLPGFVFRWRAAMNGVPDAHLYQPTFRPWLLPEFRALYSEVSRHTLLSAERAWVVYSLARQACTVEGDFLEAGVYRGGTARLLRRVLDRVPGPRSLHLFDTFAGMPRTDPFRDRHQQNDFRDTSVESVSAFVGRAQNIVYHKGLVPDTFTGLDDIRLAFSHIDVDIHKSVLDCCRFLYPHTARGGIMLFDDYGFPSCPGARQAVDEFFADKPEFPIVLRTGQAVLFRTAVSQ